MTSNLEEESRIFHERITDKLLELPSLVIEKNHFYINKDPHIDNIGVLVVNSLAGIFNYLSTELMLTRVTEYEVEPNAISGYHGVVCRTLIYRINPVTGKVLKDRFRTSTKRYLSIIGVSNGQKYGLAKIPEHKQQRELF